MPKHTGGRPTLYDHAFINKVDKYLEENQDVWDEFHKTRGSKSDTYERVVQVNLPTVERFARFIGVHKDSLYEWKGLYPEFSDALDKIVEEQKHRLMEEGLANNYNPAIAKLILSSNHGMAEKTEEKHEHSGELKITSADKAIQEIDSSLKK